MFRCLLAFPWAGLLALTSTLFACELVGNDSPGACETPPPRDDAHVSLCACEATCEVCEPPVADFSVSCTVDAVVSDASGGNVLSLTGCQGDPGVTALGLRYEGTSPLLNFPGKGGDVVDVQFVAPPSDACAQAASGYTVRDDGGTLLIGSLACRLLDESGTCVGGPDFMPMEVEAVDEGCPVTNALGMQIERMGVTVAQGPARARLIDGGWGDLAAGQGYVVHALHAFRALGATGDCAQDFLDWEVFLHER